MFNQATIFMIFVVAVFNVATIKLLTVALSQVNIKDAVKEKIAETTVSQPAPGLVVGPETTTTTGLDQTSYSRVAGLIGAVVIASFYWAVGNVILYKAFVEPDSVGTFLSGLSTYFLAGASLFLPYAFNQLRDAFAPR